MSKNIIKRNNGMNDRKGIHSFVKREIIKLKFIRKRSKIFWIIITILIALCNITVVFIAIFALVGISEKGGAAIIPASLVCLVTITLFVMGFVLAFYQNLKQDYKYKCAIDTIQNEYMKFSNNVNVYDINDEKQKQIILKRQIKKDLFEIFKHEEKINSKKIFINTLIGDKND